MVKCNIACVECIDVHLIPLPEFVVLASLYVRFGAVNVAEGLCGLENNGAGIHTEFVSLKYVNEAICYGGQPLEALGRASYRRSEGTARSICGDHL